MLKTKTTGSLSNQLLGRVLQRSEHANEMMWPTNWRANISGEMLGVVEAAWTEDGNVKVAVRNPVDGQVAEVFLVHHRLLAERS